MGNYVVAGQLTDLPDTPNRIILDTIKAAFPNPFNTTSFGNAIQLTHYKPITETGDIRFEIDQYLENTDYQISVLDETTKAEKRKISLGRNSLYEFIYKPYINIHVRKNVDTRPDEIDDIKLEIDRIITDKESSMPHGIEYIMCDPAEEILEREFISNEETEDIDVLSTWHVKIQVYLKVYKWFVPS